MKIHRKHISIPASFMCVRNTIGKFCYSNWSYSYELVALTNISIGIWILGKPCSPCEPWRM